MLSARSSTTNLSSADSGILPNLEYKLTQSSNGSKSSVLKDGLHFIRYGAQAISQVNDTQEKFLNNPYIFFFKDEFSKCFKQRPRSSIISYLLKGLRAPFSFAGLLYRYFVLFPMRWACASLLDLSLSYHTVNTRLSRLAYLLGASAAFFAALPIVLYLKNERWRVCPWSFPLVLISSLI